MILSWLKKVLKKQDNTFEGEDLFLVPSQTVQTKGLLRPFENSAQAGIYAKNTKAGGVMHVKIYKIYLDQNK